MWLINLTNKLIKVVRPVTWWVNSVGVGVLVLMMFLTAADVSLRYIFNLPILGSYEITEYMMAILVAFTIAYTAFTKGHVNVDLIVNRLPKRLGSAISIVTNLICVVLFSLIAWRSFYQAGVLHNAAAVSPALSIPEFPFVIITGIGFSLISVVFILHLLEASSEVITKWNR